MIGRPPKPHSTHSLCRSKAELCRGLWFVGCWHHPLVKTDMRLIFLPLPHITSRSLQLNRDAPWFGSTEKATGDLNKCDVTNEDASTRHSRRSHGGIVFISPMESQRLRRSMPGSTESVTAHLFSQCSDSMQKS